MSGLARLWPSAYTLLLSIVVLLALPYLERIVYWLRHRNPPVPQPIAPPQYDTQFILLLQGWDGETEHEITLYGRPEAPPTYTYAGKHYRQELGENGVYLYARVDPPPPPDEDDVDEEEEYLT